LLAQISPETSLRALSRGLQNSGYHLATGLDAEPYGRDGFKGGLFLEVDEKSDFTILFELVQLFEEGGLNFAQNIWRDRRDIWRSKCRSGSGALDRSSRWD
jgi:hypothetical protein